MAVENIRKWTVGGVDIWRIVELNDHKDPMAMLLEGGSPELALQYDWLSPHFITPEGEMRISFQAFVLKAIREDIDLTRHMDDAVKSLAVCLAADESVRSGAAVKL